MWLRTPFSLADLAFGLIFGLTALAVFSLWTRRSPDEKTLMAALVVKFAAALAQGAIAIYYYGGVADTIGYHTVGLEYADMIRSDLANGTLNYLSTNPFFWVGGSPIGRFYSLSGLVHFLLFDSFTACTLFFAALSFVGQVLLYRTFTTRYPDPRLRLWWKIGILFFPSLTFWSAAMLKDAIGIWGLGCAVWGVHCFLQKPTGKSLGLTAAGLYSLFLFRYHVLPALLIALIPWLLENPQPAPGRARQVLMSSSLRRFICACILVIGLIGMRSGGPSAQYALEALPENLSEQSSKYRSEPLVKLETSWSGMFMALPTAVATALYRPFVWEAPTFLMLLAAAENVVLLILTLRAIFQLLINPSLFIRLLHSPTFFTCVIFVAAFAFVVGASTPNLGTLSRYRIPLIPFLMGALIILEYHLLEVRARVKRPAPKVSHRGHAWGASLEHSKSVG